MQQHQPTDILIIGGGVIGLTCAYYLAREGRRVRLIESSAIGAGASHGNCGLLFFSDILPLCQPGVVRANIGDMFRAGSPLRVKLDLNAAKWAWLLRFALRCNRYHMQRAVAAREKLIYVSRRKYHELIVQEQMACDWQRRGVLMVFRSRQGMDDHVHVNDWLKKYGLAARAVPRTELLQMEPALHPDVCGAWYNPGDSHLRPEKLLKALKRVVEKKGVEVLEQCRLRAFEKGPGRIAAAATDAGILRAGHYVLATGAWTPQVTRSLKLNLPIQPGKGYSLTVGRPENCPRIPCYFHEARVVATPWSDGLRLGGTMEFAGFDERLDPSRLAGLRNAARDFLRTSLPPSGAEEWTGLRPMTPDDLPIIGQAPGCSNLILAAGHGMMGITMATGTGCLVADLVTGREPSVDPAPFSPARFS